MMRATLLASLACWLLTYSCLYSDDAAAFNLGSEARQAIPTEEEQAAAKGVIEQLYAADLSQRDKEQRAALADRLISDSRQQSIKPPQRYMLLQLAGQLAAEAGDAEQGVQSVRLLAEGFEVRLAPAALELLTKTMSAAVRPDQAEVLAEQCLLLIPDALKSGELDAAAELARLAGGAAVRAKEPDLRRFASERSRSVEEYREELAKAEQAQATLEQDPNNPDASTALGRFECFFRDDWSNGLPLLETGSDPILKQLAQRDLAPGAQSDALAVGHEWWDRSERETGGVKAAMAKRAAHWYEIALPRATGLNQALLEKRMAEAEALANPALPPRDVKGKFLIMVKGKCVVFVNGRAVVSADDEARVQVSPSIELTEGDVLAIGVESPYVYRACRVGFFADDGTNYLPIRRGDLKDVTGHDAAAVDTAVIGAATKTATQGRQDRGWDDRWRRRVGFSDQCEWFFGPDRGRYLFALVVDQELYREIRR